MYNTVKRSKFLLSRALHAMVLVAGAHIRMVWSSLADANILCLVGFQLTQFTVILWPGNTSISRVLCRFHM